MEIIQECGVKNKKLLGLIRNFFYQNDFKKEILPQGPAFSHILANIYLNKFDDYINKKSVDYFRYVDDIWIIFKVVNKEKKRRSKTTPGLALGCVEPEGLKTKPSLVQAQSSHKFYGPGQPDAARFTPLASSPHWPPHSVLGWSIQSEWLFHLNNPSKPNDLSKISRLASSTCFENV